ncbi:hypothetical protein C0J52_00209, partial [Blattella germanica]
GTTGSCRTSGKQNFELFTNRNASLEINAILRKKLNDSKPRIFNFQFRDTTHNNFADTRSCSLNDDIVYHLLQILTSDRNDIRPIHLCISYSQIKNYIKCYNNYNLSKALLKILSPYYIWLILMLLGTLQPYSNYDMTIFTISPLDEEKKKMRYSESLYRKCVVVVVA